MTENKLQLKSQNIVIEDRNLVTITGVEQVDSFNDNNIILSTIKGGLSIKGEGLNVAKLNLDDGSVKISGVINSIVYVTKEGTPKNLIGKIFK